MFHVEHLDIQLFGWERGPGALNRRLDRKSPGRIVDKGADGCPKTEDRGSGAARACPLARVSRKRAPFRPAAGSESPDPSKDLRTGSPAMSGTGKGADRRDPRGSARAESRHAPPSGRAPGGRPRETPTSFPTPRRGRGPGPGAGP